MESQIDNIDKKIVHLRDTMLEKYNESIKDINIYIDYAKQAAIDKAVQNRAALIKELDDRLALVKQFPSVLEADVVTSQEIQSDFDFRIEYQGSFRLHPSTLNMKQGKWKVLFLAKRID